LAADIMLPEGLLPTYTNVSNNASFNEGQQET
jgi:hypothetical protein